mmetsp:Transcript_84117/g.116934  ORF Transcript_84117/g.116934 Transcript_84117/m.116934 type:complete len:223 (+) Transcript_84117:403-1071(+)
MAQRNLYHHLPHYHQCHQTCLSLSSSLILLPRQQCQVAMGFHSRVHRQDHHYLRHHQTILHPRSSLPCLGWVQVHHHQTLTLHQQASSFLQTCPHHHHHHQRDLSPHHRQNQLTDLHPHLTCRHQRVRQFSWEVGQRQLVSSHLHRHLHRKIRPRLRPPRVLHPHQTNCQTVQDQSLLLELQRWDAEPLHLHRYTHHHRRRLHPPPRHLQLHLHHRSRLPLR